MNPGFDRDQILVRSGDGLNFVLAEPFSYTTKIGETITVPVGTTSDGASVPRILWLSIPPFGPYWRPAFLHDYLYRDTQRPESECDALLLESMESLGVNTDLAKTIYEGVHLAGWKSFSADRAALAAAAAQPVNVTVTVLTAATETKAP